MTSGRADQLTWKLATLFKAPPVLPAKAPVWFMLVGLPAASFLRHPSQATVASLTMKLAGRPLFVSAVIFMLEEAYIATLRRILMNNVPPIERSNLSLAWAEAFLALMTPGCAEITPLIVTVNGIDGYKIPEHVGIRDGL